MYVLVKLCVRVCVCAQLRDKINSHNRAKRTDRDNTEKETEIKRERERQRKIETIKNVIKTQKER